MSRVGTAVVAAALAAIAGVGPAVSSGFDGTWQANGQSVGRGCSLSWFLRLTVAQGQASGIVALGAGTQTLQNLVLQPDGSFAAIVAAAVSVSTKSMQEGHVSGKLSRDTITATFVNPSCGARDAKGSRLSQ
jgi:hypothetical protein